LIAKLAGRHKKIMHGGMVLLSKTHERDVHEELEIRANQRVVLPVTTAGTKPIVLELSPRTYTMKTPQIVVSWGPMVMPAS